MRYRTIQRLLLKIWSVSVFDSLILLYDWSICITSSGPFQEMFQTSFSFWLHFIPNKIFSYLGQTISCLFIFNLDLIFCLERCEAACNEGVWYGANTRSLARFSYQFQMLLIKTNGLVFDILLRDLLFPYHVIKSYLGQEWIHLLELIKHYYGHKMMAIGNDLIAIVGGYKATFCGINNFNRKTWSTFKMK